MSLLRAFIAIELPLHVCEAIQKQTDRLRQTLGDDFIRWVPTQNMHLTLKFLGDTSTSHLDFLKQMLVREANLHSPFDLQLGGLGSFPTPRNPKVLWIGIHTPPGLTSLQRGVEAGVSRLGYKGEERAFSPHLTIARTRQNASLSELQKIRTALDKIQLGNIGTARVDSVHLFKSDLQPGGSIYTKLFSASLSKP
jgi:RNA 2',3'-cyclic 3'-phosphodiesterase